MECERISPASRQNMPLVPSTCETNTRFERHSRTLCLFSCHESCGPWSNLHTGAEAGTLIGCSSSKRPTTCPPAQIWRAGPSRVQGSATAEPIAELHLWQVQNLHRPLRNHAGPGPVLATKNRPVTVTSAKQLQTEEMADPYVPRWVLTGSLFIWG